MAHGERVPGDQPSAGQGSRSALTLVVGSVVPVVVSTVLAWRALGLTPGGFGIGVLLGCGFLSIVTPYLVGWVRSYLGLVGSAVALVAIKDALQGEPGFLMVLASVALVAGIGGLIWFSLRFGHVWRPADARDWTAAKSAR